jgi:DNA-binding NtrC family response regulator
VATILIADDDRQTRETLAELLQAAGHKTFGAASAAALLDLASERPDFDLVLTDLKMPRTDGVQLLETIRARHPHARVIVMSAYSTADTVVAAFRRGAADYLQKPFDWQELQDALARALTSVASADSHPTRRPRDGGMEGAE